jgi:hypothetical protein
MPAAPDRFVSHDHLLFGASGAVGRHLLRRLQHQAIAITAVGRSPMPAWAGGWSMLHWQRGALEQLPPPAASRPLNVLSAGPLDAFADWVLRSPLPAGSRLVALSSMSTQWKLGSPNPAERALAERLLQAEQRLAGHAGRHALRLVLLRPTMIYGAGIDRSLTPLLQAARRWRCLPWPVRGRGLRQPVHADDLAAAMQAALQIDPPPAPLPLPGADCLAFDRLIDRMLARLAPPARRLPLPVPLPAALLQRLAGAPGRLGASAAQLWRSGQDQLADPDGWRPLQLAPRGFMPSEADFSPW